MFVIVPPPVANRMPVGVSSVTCWLKCIHGRTESALDSPENERMARLMAHSRRCFANAEARGSDAAAAPDESEFLRKNDQPAQNRSGQGWLDLDPPAYCAWFSSGGFRVESVRQAFHPRQ
jgi:hypothetical protein